MEQNELRMALFLLPGHRSKNVKWLPTKFVSPLQRFSRWERTSSLSRIVPGTRFTSNNQRTLVPSSVTVQKNAMASSTFLLTRTLRKPPLHRRALRIDLSLLPYLSIVPSSASLGDSSTTPPLRSSRAVCDSPLLTIPNT